MDDFGQRMAAIDKRLESLGVRAGAGEPPQAEAEAPQPEPEATGSPSGPMSRAEVEKTWVHEERWVPTRQEIEGFSMEQFLRWRQLGSPEADEDRVARLPDGGMTNVPEPEPLEP